MTIELPYIENYSDADYEVAEQMCSALFHRLTNNTGATSLPYWMNKFSNHNQANRMIIRLANDGVIKTTVEYNYASIELNRDYILQYISEDELYALIRENKLNHYKPISRPSSQLAGATKVKLASGITQSGLLRTGFAKCGTHAYKYDIAMMRKYREAIVVNAIKSMKSLEAKLKRSLRTAQDIDYEATIVATIDYIISNESRDYVLGELLLDSRGRAIYKCLSTVFNPIANKFARSLVIAPDCYITKEEQLDDTYLFIAELVAGFNGDIEQKLQDGKRFYQERTLPSVTKNDDVFEIIWCERIYADLDAYYLNELHAFTTPIEEDFSSSNMVVIGLLLGHSDYIDHTKYMWEINGLSKLHVKKAQTPYVFGSRAPITRLWAKAGLTWTAEQIRVMRQEQINGKFAIANELKDLIIMHSNPTPVMNLVVDRETFKVECTRHTIVGDTTKQYVVYHSATKALRVISHTDIVKVPDLFQFRTYFVTGLIHNLDSQIMNNMVKAMSWVIPIHDAGLVTVASARQFKELAVTQMEHVYANRKAILLNYFKSINMDNAGYARYARLQAKVDELNANKSINITPYLLK